MPTVLRMSVLGSSTQRYEVISEPEETNAAQGLDVRRFAVGAALAVACAFGLLSGRLPVPAGQAAVAVDEASAPGSVVLTHGVVRGAGGAVWDVERLSPLEGSGGSDSDARFAAMGAFTDASEHPSYFGVLHVRSVPTPAFSDEERAEASGVLEGYLTHERMHQTAANLRCEVACDGTFPPEIAGFLATQDEWTEEMVGRSAAAAAAFGPEGRGSAPGSSASAVGAAAGDATYWRHVGFLRRQLGGLRLGSALAGAEVAATGTWRGRPEETDAFEEDNAGDLDLKQEARKEAKRDRREGQGGDVGGGVDLSVGVSVDGLATINNLGDLFDIKPAVLASQHREDFSKVRTGGCRCRCRCRCQFGWVRVSVRVTQPLSDVLAHTPADLPGDAHGSVGEARAALHGGDQGNGRLQPAPLGPLVLVPLLQHEPGAHTR